jgi:hypothetical protein
VTSTEGRRETGREAHTTMGVTSPNSLIVAKAIAATPPDRTPTMTKSGSNRTVRSAEPAKAIVQGTAKYCTACLACGKKEFDGSVE